LEANPVKSRPYLISTQAPAGSDLGAATGLRAGGQTLATRRKQIKASDLLNPPFFGSVFEKKLGPAQNGWLKPPLAKGGYFGPTVSFLTIPGGSRKSPSGRYGRVIFPSKGLFPLS
jgi:hypothetical protein